jgi:hypothetical protein
MFALLLDSEPSSTTQSLGLFPTLEEAARTGHDLPYEASLLRILPVGSLYTTDPSKKTIPQSIEYLRYGVRKDTLLNESRIVWSYTSEFEGLLQTKEEELTVYINTLNKKRAVLRSLHNLEANNTAAPCSFAVFLQRGDSIPRRSGPTAPFYSGKGTIQDHIQRLADDIESYKYATTIIQDEIEVMRGRVGYTDPEDTLVEKDPFARSYWMETVQYTRHPRRGLNEEMKDPAYEEL